MPIVLNKILEESIYEQAKSSENFDEVQLLQYDKMFIELKYILHVRYLHIQRR